MNGNYAGLARFASFSRCSSSDLLASLTDLLVSSNAIEIMPTTRRNALRNRSMVASPYQFDKQHGMTKCVVKIV